MATATASRAALKQQRQQNLCPVCGDYPVGGNTLSLVQWMGALKLAEEGVLNAGVEPQLRAMYGDHYAGPGFLLTGMGAFRVDMDNAVGLLLRAIRDERALEPELAFGDNDPVCIVVSRRSVLVSEAQKIARRAGQRDFHD